jgi:hypothetical protein
MSDLGIGTGGQAGADQWSGQQKQDPYILYLCVPNLPFLRSKQVGRWLCGSRGLCNDRSARRGKQRSDRGCHEARPARYTKSHAGSSKQPALLLCFIRTTARPLRRGRWLRWVSPHADVLRGLFAAAWSAALRKTGLKDGIERKNERGLKCSTGACRHLSMSFSPSPSKWTRPGDTPILRTQRLSAMMRVCDDLNRRSTKL